MYTNICSNSDTLKDRKLEAKTSEISIAVMLDDVRKETADPVFYASRFGRLYDPVEFKPNQKGGQRLNDHLIEEYWNLLPTAKYKYKDMLKNENKPSGNNGNTSPEKDEQIEAYKKILLEKEAEIQKQAEAYKKAIAELEQAKNTTRKDPRHAKIDACLTILKKGVSVYMHGPAGTGKSKLAEQLAEELELKFYPASTVTQEFKLSGYKDANGLYHDTNFYKAVKNGGLFFLDEMDSCTAEVLVGLNGCLANKYYDFPEGTITAHKDFIVVGAGNTIGRGAVEGYEGRNALDISTLDRFMGVPIGYSPEIDLVVAKGNTELVEFAHAVRATSEEYSIGLLMSYRAIDRIVLFEEDFELPELMEMALIKGSKSEDMMMLARNMNISNENKYYKAFKAAAR